ncbi:MAG: (deoxy)nucleoside triphosphate pyrophosphohydrolase [Pseudomonadota bacterium]
MIRAVVAGVLWSADHRVLIATRPPGKIKAGLWEFPGGKVEPGEDCADALRRELREEIGVRIKNYAPVYEFKNPHRPVYLRVYLCTRWDGRVALAQTCPHRRLMLRGKDHQGLRWVRLDQLRRYPMPPPCRAMIHTIQRVLLNPAQRLTGPMKFFYA